MAIIYHRLLNLGLHNELVWNRLNLIHEEVWIYCLISICWYLWDYGQRLCHRCGFNWLLLVLGILASLSVILIVRFVLIALLFLLLVVFEASSIRRAVAFVLLVGNVQTFSLIHESLKPRCNSLTLSLFNFVFLGLGLRM